MTEFLCGALVGFVFGGGLAILMMCLFVFKRYGGED
jgi:hypothetical protein